jgi:hypothetical protein
MVTLELVVTGLSGSRRRGYLLKEHEEDKFVDDLYFHVTHKMGPCHPPGEFVILYDGIPLKRHLPFSYYFMVPIRCSTARVTLTFAASNHRLEPVSLDRFPRPGDLPIDPIATFHSYEVSHVNQLLLPQLLTVDFVGVSFPTDVWTLCTQYLTHPLPLHGSRHRRHYDAWYTKNSCPFI